MRTKWLHRLVERVSGRSGSRALRLDIYDDLYNPCDTCDRGDRSGAGPSTTPQREPAPSGAAPLARVPISLVTSVVRLSCFLLLALLPLTSFAQAHLLKQRPFRATDTVQPGGDHICDLRRDNNGDGRPERLGDYVRVCGALIAEPSTFLPHAEPRTYGGDLVTISGLWFTAWWQDSCGNIFALAVAGSDTIAIYFDRDAGFARVPDCGRCYSITGVVTKIETPRPPCPRLVWCVAPRSQYDLVPANCSPERAPTTWGAAKALFGSW
jgi:hypothetical protein